jgi:hypothetical protein
LSAATKICVIEIREAIGSSPDFSSIAKLFPFIDLLDAAHFLEKISNTFTVTNHYAENIANFSRFGVHSKSSGNPYQSHRRFISRGNNLE